MPAQLVNAGTFAWKDGMGNDHRANIWTTSPLGDWAAISLDGHNFLEIGGNAIARATIVVEALIAAAGAGPLPGPIP